MKSCQKTPSDSRTASYHGNVMPFDLLRLKSRYLRFNVRAPVGRWGGHESSQGLGDPKTHSQVQMKVETLWFI